MPPPTHPSVGGKGESWVTFTSPHRTSYHNPKKYVCFEYITFFISEKTSDGMEKNEEIGKTENDRLRSSKGCKSSKNQHFLVGLIVIFLKSYCNILHESELVGVIGGCWRLLEAVEATHWKIKYLKFGCEGKYQKSRLPPFCTTFVHLHIYYINVPHLCGTFIHEDIFLSTF